MSKLRAKRRNIDPARRKSIREQINGYAKKPSQFKTDPSHLLRDRKTGLVIAPSNDDFGTKERRAHDRVELEGDKTKPHARVTTATLLDTMRNRKNLAFEKDGDHERLWNAGDRLRADFYLAGMEPRVISTLNDLPGGKGEMSDRAIAARQRMASALAAVGPLLAPILQHVVCDDKPISEWSRKRGRQAEIVSMTLFKAAIETLAHHYGY